MTLGARTPGDRRTWGARYRLIHGGCGPKSPQWQIIGGEILKIDVIGANAFQGGLGSLGGTNDGEFGDEIIFAGLVDGLELCGTGMGEMMKIEGVRNDAFQAVLWSPS
jgi:hypothetical protein